MTRQWIAACLTAVAASGLALVAAGPALYSDREIDTGLGKVDGLAFSGDGRLLAAGGAGGYGIWDAQTGSSIRRDTSTGGVERVALDGAGIVLAAGTSEGGVIAVDLRSGTSLDMGRHKKPVTAIAVSGDGRAGVSGDADGNILLWEPARGPVGALVDGGQRKEILLLAFGAGNTLLSVSGDLRVVTWDLMGKRPLRRGTLQADVSGRTVVASAASADPAATRLVLASQSVSEQRGGMFSGGGPVRPTDVRRDNLLMPFTTATGIAGDPIRSGDFLAEHVALSPSGCFALMTSFFRDQPRLHVWGLVERGDDLTRIDLKRRATAVAVEPGGRLVAVASDTGHVATWGMSGATAVDCDRYANPSTETAVAAARVVMGAESEPLLSAASGLRIAVLRFEATGVDATLGEGIAELLAGQLANTAGIVVIERSAIETVLRELEIQRSGLTTGDAVRIGHGLNARKVLFGSVRRFGDDTYVIQTRLVDVETQRVEGAREVTCERCKEQDLPRALDTLRRALVR